MRAIVMIVANVIGKKSFQLSLVPCDDVLEQIPAAAFHPALGHSVLPGTPDRGSHAADLQGANGSQYFQCRISERDHRVGIWERIGKERLLLAAVRSNCWWDAE